MTEIIRIRRKTCEENMHSDASYGKIFFVFEESLRQICKVLRYEKPYLLIFKAVLSRII